MKAERSSSSLVSATGRDYAEWFDRLDQWGAAGRRYAEIARWLTDQGVSRWWAQKLIVEYEQDRGIRRPGARPDGTFTATASKTVRAPVEQVFAAVVDRQSEWLGSGTLQPRRAAAPHRASFDLQDDRLSRSRVQFTIEAPSVGKSIVAVEHSRLPDAEAAEQQKIFWRDQLGNLARLFG